MFKIRTLSLALLTAALCSRTAGGAEHNDLRTLPYTALKQHRTAIDRELASLANYSLRSGTGAIGYRSNFYDDEFHTEWIEVEFQAEHALDNVILVPVIRRDAQTGFQADGFPRSFRLIAGTRSDLRGTVVAEYTPEQRFLPRIAPLVIPCGGISASWIRIEADRLSLRAFDERYAFQLSEIMAFSGPENAALHQLVHSKSNRRDGLAWGAQFAVDGFVPYLMDAASGEKSVAFMSRINPENLPSLTIDLGRSVPVSRLHLHAIDTSDVLPQALSSDFGIPRRMHLEGAGRPDFSDAVPLLDLNLSDIYHMAPVMVWTFPQTACRYVRLNITEPAADRDHGAAGPRFGFAEIELYSPSGNAALGRPVTGTNILENPNRSCARLTDGRNMYGTILSTRTWMEQLARRHDLETERPRVEAELNARHERQKNNLRRLGWLSALLAGGIGATFLIDRLLRLRQIRAMEQRIAADLHDELGANLHTIGLLSDLAENAKNSPEERSLYHQRIRDVTERSGIAVRSCTNMFSSTALSKGLRDDMQRTAQRIMAGIEHDFAIEGEENISRLRPRTCFDLFLFYKESLVNISRHSGATRFSTRLKITPARISLTIRDTGRGLAGADSAGIPKSLKRRARLLRAEISVETPPEGGTAIHLQIRPRRGGRLFRRNLS